MQVYTRAYKPESTHTIVIHMCMHPSHNELTVALLFSVLDCKMPEQWPPHHELFDLKQTQREHHYSITVFVLPAIPAYSSDISLQ